MAAENTGLSTGEKVGMVISGLAALAGVAIGVAGVIGDKKDPEKPDGKRRLRFGKKSCSPCKD